MKYVQMLCSVNCFCGNEMIFLIELWYFFSFPSRNFSVPTKVKKEATYLNFTKKIFLWQYSLIHEITYVYDINIMPKSIKLINLHIISFIFSNTKLLFFFIEKTKLIQCIVNPSLSSQFHVRVSDHWIFLHFLRELRAWWWWWWWWK